MGIPLWDMLHFKHFLWACSLAVPVLAEWVYAFCAGKTIGEYPLLNPLARNINCFTFKWEIINYLVTYHITFFFNSKYCNLINK